MGAVTASELVGGIYEAGLDSGRWPAFMDKLALSLHAGFGTLWMHDFSAGSAVSLPGAGDVCASTGLDAPTIAEYGNHHAARNVWVPNTQRLAEGAITVSSALYPETLLKRTQFYADFLGPNDLFHALGSSIVKEGTRDVKMGFVRSEAAGPYTAAELRLVRGLMPHLRNAVRLHQALHRAKMLSRSSMAALEVVPVGIILLTSAGLLLHANGRAYELMARTEALRFGPSGALVATGAAATASLQRLVRECVQTTAGRGFSHGGALRLQGAHGQQLQVLVTPLAADSSAVGGEPMSAVFCADPSAPVGALAQRLAATYGMTPAEAQLTEAVVNGCVLKRVADDRGVSIHTVRAQLKSAADKAGARRQTDLVRIVLTGPAVLGTQGHSLTPAIGPDRHQPS